MTIYHIAHKSDWDKALETDCYSVSTRGATFDNVGFIHASYAHQVSKIAKFIYQDDPAELCVLVLDENLIRQSGATLIDEDGGSGEPYPHIYAPIKPEWVTDVIPAHFASNGQFIWKVSGDPFYHTG